MSNTSSPISRRHLIKVLGGGLTATLLASVGVQAEERRRGGGSTDSSSGGAAAGAGADKSKWPLAEPGKDIALGVAYHVNHEDAAKDPKTDKTTDKGVAWDKRFCKSCMFYTAAGKKDGKDVGACQIFPNKLVVSEGICNTWTKKAT